MTERTLTGTSGRLYQQVRVERQYQSETDPKRLVVESTVTYIPRRWAKLGQVLRLKSHSGTWTDGWRVIFVSSLPPVPEEQLPDHHKAIRQHRKRTGDSLPKDRKE